MTHYFVGSIGARVKSLDYTGSTVILKQHKAIQNPFRSIHLAALINAGELVFEEDGVKG